jgi:hypothetical protein
VAGWEQRAKKLESRRQRQQKHGRSLLTAVRAAEEKRLRELKKRAESREAERSNP